MACTSTYSLFTKHAHTSVSSTFHHHLARAIVCRHPHPASWSLYWRPDSLDRRARCRPTNHCRRLPRRHRRDSSIACHCCCYFRERSGECWANGNQNRNKYTCVSMKRASESNGLLSLLLTYGRRCRFMSLRLPAGPCHSYHLAANSFS